MVVDEIIGKLEKHLLKGFIRIAILYVVNKTETHGYRIYRSIKNNLYRGLSLSTFYTVLKELEKLGLVCRKGLTYVITEKGVETLIHFMNKYPFINIILSSTMNEKYK